MCHQGEDPWEDQATHRECCITLFSLARVVTRRGVSKEAVEPSAGKSSASEGRQRSGISISNLRFQI
jgi:hypothetical protein